MQSLSPWTTKEAPDSHYFLCACMFLFSAFVSFLCSFAGAAVTGTTVGWRGQLKQQKIPLPALEARSPRPRCRRCWFILEALRSSGSPSVLFPGPLLPGGRVSLGSRGSCRPHPCMRCLTLVVCCQSLALLGFCSISHLCLHPHVTSSLFVCVSVSKLPLFIKDTLIGLGLTLRIHQGLNPRHLHWEADSL